MPTYEYKCESCGEGCEFFQSMKDSPKKKCPKCGRMKLCRQIGGGGGFIFKGSGFYITDYRSKDYKEQAAKEKDNGSKESKKTDTTNSD